MANGSNLKRRGSTYYARQADPLELQNLIGTRELVRTFNTKDRRTANVRKLSVLAEW